MPFHARLLASRRCVPTTACAGTSGRKPGTAGVRLAGAVYRCDGPGRQPESQGEPEPSARARGRQGETDKESKQQRDPAGGPFTGAGGGAGASRSGVAGAGGPATGDASAPAGDAKKAGTRTVCMWT